MSDTITNFNWVPYQSTHINGGTVIGADPGTSVVNKYCRWDAKGLMALGATGSVSVRRRGGTEQEIAHRPTIRGRAE